MITNPNQTKRPKRLRIALAQCERYLDSQVVAVCASLGIASLVLTVCLAVLAPQPDTLSTVFALLGSLIMSACSVLLLAVACFEYADKQEQANTARRNRSHLANLNHERKMRESEQIHALASAHHLRYWLNRYKCERDQARQERDEARKQASTNAFALIGSLMGDIETK